MAVKHRRKMKKRIFIIIFNVIFTALFLAFIYRLNILPLKYNILLSGILLLVNIGIYYMLRYRNKPLNILAYILSILFLIIYVFGTYYVNKTTSFLQKSFGTEINKYTLTYYVVSKNNIEYKNINNIGYYNDLPNLDESLKKLKNNYKNALTSYDELGTNVSDLINDKVEGMLIESNLYDFIKESFDGFNKEDYKIAYEYKLVIKEKIKAKKNNSNSINIYIGGTDFTNIYTDFNMLVTINMDTHKILLTSTPRDFYLEVPGKNKKDLLSYAGVFGINSSKESIANLYDVDIDYYMKINTNSLVKLVDVLDGLEFCSDTNFTTTHAQIVGSYDDSLGRKLRVKSGCHEYNGVQILTIARERKAFAGGDRQRQKNCQDIIVSLFKKMTNASNVSRYTEILDAVSDLYTTNIPTELVQDFIKDTVDGAKWTFEQQSVTGTDSRGYVHLGTVEDYVMLPDEESINNAKVKIKKIYN